jgi:RNA polymerase primary sigma factor
MDYLPDLFAAPPDAETYDQALNQTVDNALATISEREARILRLYFGLEGEEPKTLEEIGLILGITRERVRQIKERALARMRHASRARLLDPFHN